MTSEGLPPSSESEEVTLKGSEVLGYYDKLADELDLQERDLKDRLEADPALVNDDEAYAEWIGLKAKKDLLEKVGRDLSDYTQIHSVDRFLRQMFGEETEQDEI